ncbi:MAG: L-threonylcarbamoyladenylate synthase [Rickettsiales bacterium]|jgi:L-threonylcarbamoyladenylate synthase|nr:L-threonylcarbamoyladenylate synthase [Rickettsiales bacterium]
MIEKAICEILAGGVVAAPAGTTFGLVCDPFCTRAVEEIFRLKRRPRDKALLLNALDVGAVSCIASVGREEAALLENFDITLILRANAGGTVGARLARDPVMRRLLAGAGGLLVSTSANVSGGEPCLSAAAVREAFPGLTVLDEEAPQSGIPSTIACIENGAVQILRAGAVGKTTLKVFLSKRSLIS